MTDITGDEKGLWESRITTRAADFNSDEEKRRAGLDAMNELNRQLRLLADIEGRMKEKQEIKDEISILKETKKKGKLSSKKNERLAELKGELSAINAELEALGLPRGMNARGLNRLHDQRIEEYVELTAALGRTSTETNAIATTSESQMKLKQEQLESLNTSITAAEEAKKKAEELVDALSKIDIENAVWKHESTLRTVERLKQELDELKKDLQNPIMLPDSQKMLEMHGEDKQAITNKEKELEFWTEESAKYEKEVEKIKKLQSDLAAAQEKASRLDALVQERDGLSDALETLKRNIENESKSTPETKAKTPIESNVQSTTEKTKEAVREPEKKKIQYDASVISDYAALLRAKQRWRNIAVKYKEKTLLFSSEMDTEALKNEMGKHISQNLDSGSAKATGMMKAGGTTRLTVRKKAYVIGMKDGKLNAYGTPSKTRDFTRKVLGVRKDEKILSREKEIREKFISTVDDCVAEASDDKGKRAAVEEIYTDVANKFAKGKGRMDRALMWLRKPAGMAIRIGLGVGLGAAAFLTGGVAAAVVGMTVYGIASRYLLVDGTWDKIHHLYTGRAKKGEYGMAAQLFYNNSRKIATVGEKVYADAAKISGKALDEASIKYAHNIGRNRFWKKLAAVAYAVLPPVISGGAANLFASHKTVPHPAGTPAIAAPEAAATATPAPDLYTVPKGGGIWHICKAIAHEKMPGFDNLSVADQNIAINAMKDAVIADPGKYGLEPSEIIPRALDKGGPWLRLGADMHAKDIVSFVPKRIMDTLGLGNNALTAAGIKAAVKGAINHGDISKAVAAGHAILKR